MCTVGFNNAQIQAVGKPGQCSNVPTLKMTGGLGCDSQWRERFFSLCPDMQGYTQSYSSGDMVALVFMGRLLRQEADHSPADVYIVPRPVCG